MASELLNTQGKMDQLSTSLLEAQNENKAVHAKLAASRVAAASVESVSAKVPGSAMKANGHIRTLMVGSAEAAQAAQVAQLKEDLYSDLTGLIVRGVKRGDDSEVYDCIQTGRNGSELDNYLSTLQILIWYASSSLQACYCYRGQRKGDQLRRYRISVHAAPGRRSRQPAIGGSP